MLELMSEAHITGPAIFRLSIRPKKQKQYSGYLRKFYTPLRPLLTCLFIFGALFPSCRPAEAQSRNVEELPADVGAYGLTYDGTSFWYSNPRTRRVYRVTRSARTSGYFVGNIRMYGMGYNPLDGFIYLGSSRRLIRINPATGAIENSIPVPVERVAGIAFGNDVWYLLEKGTGTIYFYNPELGRNIDSLITRKPELRDLAASRGYLWASDGKSGIIYRYRIEDRSLAGSISGPTRELRGLCFREGQLWVIRRGKSVVDIKRLPYTENDHYIISGEKTYKVRVKLSVRLPPRKRSGFLIVPQPPRNLTQTPRGIKTPDNSWSKRFSIASGERVFSRKIPASPAGGEKIEFAYEYRVTLNNIRFFLPKDFRPEEEDLDTSDAYYYSELDPEDFNKGNPFADLKTVLKSFAGRDRKASSYLFEALRKKGAAVRWVELYRPGNKTGPAESFRAAEVYIRNLGWLPLSLPLEDARNLQVYSRDDRTIQLYRLPDGRARGISPVYFGEGDSVGELRELKAITARPSVDVIPLNRN